MKRCRLALLFGLTVAGCARTGPQPPAEPPASPASAPKATPRATADAILRRFETALKDGQVIEANYAVGDSKSETAWEGHLIGEVRRDCLAFDEHPREDPIVGNRLVCDGKTLWEIYERGGHSASNAPQTTVEKGPVGWLAVYHLPAYLLIAPEKVRELFEITDAREDQIGNQPVYVVEGRPRRSAAGAKYCAWTLLGGLGGFREPGWQILEGATAQFIFARESGLLCGVEFRGSDGRNKTYQFTLKLDAAVEPEAFSYTLERSYLTKFTDFSSAPPEATATRPPASTGESQ